MTWILFLLVFNDTYEPRVVWISKMDTRAECLVKAESYRHGYDNIVATWCEAENGQPRYLRP